MAFGGAALRVTLTFLYALAFCCATIILGIYSYFLATISSHDVSGPTWLKAVEGISGAGVLYTIFAVILTCFLGGKTFFAFLGLALDILFAIGFIAIAVMTRHGAGSCTGFVRTPLGNGPATTRRGWGGAVFTPRLRTVCRMNKAVFAVALIGVLVFVLCALVQIFLGRHHSKEKRYGPSPANNYTKGNGIRFFKRRGGSRSAHAAAAKDAEAGVVQPNSVHQNGVAATETYPNRYETPATTNHSTAVPVAGGYHTAPGGAAVNPYGYDSTRPAQY